jgi:hypothetical protein
MKKKIINVVEVLDNKIVQLVSFIIIDTNEKEIISKAELLFSKIAIENGAKENDMESYIEDGYYDDGEFGGSFSVSLIWSEIN